MRNVYLRKTAVQLLTLKLLNSFITKQVNHFQLVTTINMNSSRYVGVTCTAVLMMFLATAALGADEDVVDTDPTSTLPPAENATSSDLPDPSLNSTTSTTVEPLDLTNSTTEATTTAIPLLNETSTAANLEGNTTTTAKPGKPDPLVLHPTTTFPSNASMPTTPKAPPTTPATPAAVLPGGAKIPGLEKAAAALEAVKKLSGSK